LCQKFAGSFALVVNLVPSKDEITRDFILSDKGAVDVVVVVDNVVDTVVSDL